MKKPLFVVAMVLAVLAAAFFAYETFNSKEAIAKSASKTYSGTMYVAGHGGHFAKSNVTIDPNQSDKPIKIDDLSMVSIGTPKTHAFHDARIDSEDRNIIFWSTYIPDPNGKMHVGKSNLKTGEVIKDIAMDLDPRAPAKKPPMYCASAQSKKYYMPIYMGTEGFVDVYDKQTMELKHRVFVSDLGYKPGTYKFTHGVNSPDMKKIALAINQAEGGKGNGKVDIIIVDTAELEKGKLKQLAKATFVGEPDKTLTFRQYFSNDGKYLFQSAGDRLWVIEVATLKLVDEKMIPDGGQVHDALPTPDDKYAIMTVRLLAAAPGTEGKEITDGFLMLYSAADKKIIGKPISTCTACHTNLGFAKTAVLCGIDGNWNK